MPLFRGQKKGVVELRGEDWYVEKVSSIWIGD